MDQVLWQTIHGHLFQMTSPTEGILQSRAAIHADWLLLIYTPFYALWHDPRVLTTLQVLFVASGVLPIFWLAQRQLSAGWSFGIAILFLLQPTLLWSILFDIHALVLVTPLILWGVWAAVTRRYFVMWILFGASLLGKEEVGLVIALTAVVLRLRGLISRRIAWSLGLLSLGWLALMTAVVIPFFSENGSHFAITYFSEYGRTVPEIFFGLFRHPILLWRDLVNVISLGYLAILLGSVAILPLRRPVWLLPAVPILVMNLISNDPHMQSIYYQYTAAITPFFLLASIDGLSSILKHIRNKTAVVWTISWVAIMVWVWAPLPGMSYTKDALEMFPSNQYRRVVHQLAATIPPTVHLATTNDLGPQFSRRDRIWVFPYALDRAEAVVVLLNRPNEIFPQSLLRTKLTELQQNQTWETVASWNDELFYLRRK